MRSLPSWGVTAVSFTSKKLNYVYSFGRREPNTEG